MSNIVCTNIFGETVETPKDSLEFRPSVYGCVVNSGRVLLCLMRSTGKYFLPGGAVEIGETLEEALAREVKEEAGIEIEIGNLVAHDQSFFFYDDVHRWQVLAFFFLCTPKTFILSDLGKEVGEETENPQWVSITELRPDLFQAFGNKIMNILKNIS